ncbi:hypothetical protein BJ322DRAFT_829767 [Thelephora terrestris]|uniref:Uncharacterized protein n=1 Tax=Thelephora terrestris TaxID=56493 RepID=A0A9P6L723_9AGAM|nr:hypothetical protein BJ322DRAFT_829767 [Thelephora terrestris]
MSSQTTVENLSTSVDQLDISGRRSPEFTHNAGILSFRSNTLTRDYILSHQPWESMSIPRQYIPMGKQRWFPPIFCLGVPLTLEEVIQLGRHLGLTVSEDTDYDFYAVVALRLSEICGFTGPDSAYPLHHVAVKVCDTKGQPRMLSLVTNYQMREEFDYSGPFTAMTDALDEVFDGSKKLEWWLEYSLNHCPKDFRWLKLNPAWVQDWDKTYDYED